MWQTFPEHTKNLTTASPESHFKSLNRLAHNGIQGPGFAGISVATVLSLVDVCLDPQTTEYGAIGHLAAPANSEDADGSAGWGGGVGFRPTGGVGFGCTQSACPESQLHSLEGKSYPGRGLMSHTRD